MPAPKKYEDWEEACMNSQRKVAVANVNKKIDILKPLHKGGYFTRKNMYMHYPGLGKATARQVDSVRRWESV